MSISVSSHQKSESEEDGTMLLVALGLKLVLAEIDLLALKKYSKRLPFLLGVPFEALFWYKDVTAIWTCSGGLWGVAILVLLFIIFRAFKSRSKRSFVAHRITQPSSKPGRRAKDKPQAQPE